jgi:hypothetical protein
VPLFFYVSFAKSPQITRYLPKPISLPSASDFFVILSEKFERLSDLSHLESAQVLKYVKNAIHSLYDQVIIFTFDINGYHNNDLTIITLSGVI